MVYLFLNRSLQLFQRRRENFHEYCGRIPGILWRSSLVKMGNSLQVPDTV